MEKHFAQIFYYLLHPVLLPAILIFSLMFSEIGIFYLPPALKWYVGIITISTTLLMPLLLVRLVSRWNADSFSRSKVPMKIWIMFFSSICYLIAVCFFSKSSLLGIYKLIFISGVLLQCVLISIVLRWEISISMTVIGAMTGIVIAVLYRTSSYSPYLLSGVILAGGISGFTSLQLEKSSPIQLLVGYVLGSASLFLLFVLI